MTGRTLFLRGRVGACSVAADEAGEVEPAFSLLLCARTPGKKDPANPKTIDTSATALFRSIPPKCTWGDSSAAEDHADAACSDETPRTYKFPYNLLVGRDDVILIKRGIIPKSLSAGSFDNVPGICAAEVQYPKPKKGKRRAVDEDDWEQFWREEVKRLAGKWAEVCVKLERYSFEGATYSARTGMPEKVHRVGTRLVLQSIEEIPHS